MQKLRRLAMFLVLAMIVTIVPVAVTPVLAGGDWEYTVSGDEATITKYVGTAGDVTIPATLDGKTVKKIGSQAFEMNGTIESVIIPRSINSIEHWAFQGCGTLSDVSFTGSRPDGESLNLMSGQGIFKNCSQLTMQSVNNILAENIFQGTLNTTFILCSNVTGELIIPGHITGIGGAFYQTGIESLSFESDTTINRLGGNTYGDFEGCASLKWVVLPTSISEFGDYGVFKDCSALETFEFQTVDSSILDGKSNVFSGINSNCKFTVPIGADAGQWYNALKLAGAPNTITVGNKSVIITTTTLPGGYVDIAYNQGLLAAGLLPFTWSVESGSLPDGLSLDAATGVISGTPNTEGIYSFIIKVVNANGSDTKELGIDIAAVDDNNVIPDMNLRAAINTKLEVADTTAPISIAQMQSLTGNLLASNKSITNLSGIQYAENVSILGLHSNQISDLSPLSTLSNLTELYLYNNQISNISPISGLTNLFHLSLYNNQISDISSLAGLTHLISLNLSGNQISDISSLSALLDQANLYASGQAISVSAGTNIISNHLRAIDGAVVAVTEDANVENTSDNQIRILTFDTMTDPIIVQFSDSRTDLSSKTYEFSGELEITKAAQITAPSITTVTLASGTAGTPYSQGLAASGDAPISWSVASGSLPPGLSLEASTGIISGTPTTVGTYSFTVEAANAGGKDNRGLSIDIRFGVVVLPTITTTGLANGKVGTAYSQTLAASGDTPITWSIVSGSLPDGLTLEASGVISGTPVIEGTYGFTVKAANTGGNAVKDLTIVINHKSSGGGGGGGGGGGSTSTLYSVLPGSSPENGSLSLDKTKAAAGSKVTITAIPDQGYITAAVQALDKDGREVKITANDDGTYWLVMPAGNVSIEVAFVAETASDTPAQPSIVFSDVSEGDWFYFSVVYVKEKGIMNGMSADVFGTDVNTSRAMIVTILYNLEGHPASAGGTFLDVEAPMWYYDAVSWAAQNGIVSGYDNNMFGPNDNMTREQMVTILYNYAKYKGYDVSAAVSLDSFTDVDQISAWAEVPMAWAVGSGLISGKGNGILDPGGNATRAQAATIMHNFMESTV